MDQAMRGYHFAVAPFRPCSDALSAESSALRLAGGWTRVEAAGTSICLAMKVVLLSARWAGQSGRLGLVPWLLVLETAVGLL
jgi:hypothetical protein